MVIRFEWDRRKASANFRKHGVSFDEACTLFDDPLAVIFEDEDHSENEHRELIIGHSILNRLIIASFVEKSDDLLRIISARPATRNEQKDYEENTPIR